MQKIIGVTELQRRFRILPPNSPLAAAVQVKEYGVSRSRRLSLRRALIPLSIILGLIGLLSAPVLAQSPAFIPNPLIPANMLEFSGHSVAWGDYDNDGDLDILLSGEFHTGGATSKIYRNDGGSFTDINAGLEGVSYGTVAWGDYDNDGDLDILLAGSAGNFTPLSKIYRNDGGSFSDTNIGLAGIRFGTAAWGDYDNDGDPDIMMSGVDPDDNHITKIYRNDGGGFTDTGADLAGGFISSAAWGDYDNDGDLDILLTGHGLSSPITQIYRNDEGNFMAVDFDLVKVGDGIAVWGDYDNDGDLDILLAGRGDPDGVAHVYRNDLPVANTRLSAPTGLATETRGTTVTLSWAAAGDDQTPADGLTYNLRVGKTPGAANALAPMADNATGYRRLPWWGNAHHSLSATLTLPPGTYYWSAQAIDIAFAGSAFAAEQSFTITQSPVAVNLTGPPAGQVGRSYTFTATATPPAANLPLTYTWQIDDHELVTHTDGLSNSITAGWTTAGTKTIIVTVTNRGGTVTETIPVIITDVPVAGLSAENNSPTRLGQATTLTATVTAGSNLSYTWAFGDGDSGSGANPDHLYPAAGIYTAVATAGNSANIMTAATTITVTGAPILSLSKSGPINAESGETILYTLTVTNSGNETATGLVITDVIPAGATYTGGGTRVNNLVRWTHEALPAHQSLQVQFSVTATASITNSIYSVKSAGGYGASGSRVVRTEVVGSRINRRVYLPVIIK